MVEKFSAVITTVFVHPWVHPYVVLFVCLPSVKRLKLVLHLSLNKCSGYVMLDKLVDFCLIQRTLVNHYKSFLAHSRHTGGLFWVLFCGLP